jgi:DNA-binding transcriptional regulator YhcF (GntR family)
MQDIKNEGADAMTLQQVSRLIDWLRSQGFSDEQITACIQYIAKTRK